MGIMCLFSKGYGSRKAGFTLIELLVVIAILGILAGIAVPLFIGQRTKAVKSEMETNLKLLVTLAETYYADHGVYPPALECGISTAECEREYKGTHGTVDSPKGVEDILMSFRPGKVADLKFTYKAKSLSSGQAFQAIAIGKTGTELGGKTFKMDQNNELTVE